LDQIAPGLRADAEYDVPPRCIAHDLANLLTILNGSLELADRHAADNPALGRLLANMHVVAERASALVEELRASLKPMGEC
jgi:signal transduction histidine kinase